MRPDATTLHVPPVRGHASAQNLLKETLTLVDLLDLHAPNMDRHFAVELLITCPQLTAPDVICLAQNALADARSVLDRGLRIQEGRVQSVLRFLLAHQPVPPPALEA